MRRRRRRRRRSIMGFDGADLNKRNARKAKAQNRPQPSDQGGSENGIIIGGKNYTKTLTRTAMALLLCVGLFIVAGPFLTLNSIKGGAQQGDTEKLRKNIDFESLRTNLKEQMNAQFSSDMAEEPADNPFVTMFSGLGKNVIDSFVDSAVTPYGIKKMLQGERPSAKKKESQKSRVEMLTDASYSFSSPSSFTAMIGEPENEVKFFLSRRGLKWVLTNIELPDQNNTAEARKQNREASINGLTMALKMYKLDNGRYPTTEQGLKALRVKPTLSPIPVN